MSKASKLRSLLRQDGMVVAPGAYDCITARTIAQAGFGAVYMTGAGTAATLGYPDYGLVTMSEMVDNAGRIAAAVDVPVIADADSGYGNELNVVRTVREYEQRGVAGIHIEDQGFPKKCGHLDDKVIIALDDYLAKIRAAVANAFKVDPKLEDTRAALGQENASIWVLNGGGDAGQAALLAAYLEYYGLTASAPNGKPDVTGLTKTRIVVYNGAEARIPETISFLEAKFKVKVELKQDSAVAVDVIASVGSATPALTPPPSS